MPVQANPCIQNVPAIAWAGTGTPPTVDVSKFVRYGWSFTVTAAIAADAIFEVEHAPASAANPCVPGTFSAVGAIPTCTGGAVSGNSQIKIPAGTAIGTVCSATVPCRGEAFVRLKVISGTTANVQAIIVRQGPKMGH